MAQTNDGVPGTSILTMTIDHDPVDAGSEFLLAATATCEPMCDLSGDYVSIGDGAGNELGRITFTGFDEETGASTGSLTLRAPDAAGDITWIAELPGFAVDDVRFAATSVPVAFAVRAHRTRVNVWGVPDAVTAGTRFSARVGVKCTCGCSLADQPFTVHDESGNELAGGTLEADIWPGTEALYTAEVELPAASAAGRHTWEVRFDPADLALPHEVSAGRFGVIFTPLAEHVVKVEAIDRDSQQPLAGAIVTMHPYRALTDERGVAELRVPKGAYTLFVSARRHVSDRAKVEVTGDLATRAALAIEVKPERL